MFLQAFEFLRLLALFVGGLMFGLAVWSAARYQA